MKLTIIWILLINYSVLSSDWKLVEEFDNTSTYKYSDVKSINCLDSNNCFALVDHAKVGDAGWQLFTSNDQGRTWELIYKSNVQISPSVEEGQSPNAQYYFIANYYYSKLQKSTDGGNTFKEIVLDDSDFGFEWTLEDFAMYDTNYGFVTNGYYYFTTTDGWETFDRHPKLHTNQSYYSPVFLDSNSVGMIYGSPWANSMGLGESYVKYYINEDRWDTLFYFGKGPNIWVDIIYGIFFANDSIGYACGRQINDSLADGQYLDIIYRTTDGGHNWDLIHKEYQYPYKGFYNNISFYDEKNGIAVGFYGKIAMTNDGGDTWVYEPTPNAMDNARKMLVCWAGRTPLIGTWDAGIFRYEGDFFKFPDTTDVEDEPEGEGIRIYPNPASGYIEISNFNHTVNRMVDKIRIYSVLGIKVLESEYQAQIDVSLLSPGVYFLKAGKQIIKFVKY